MRGTTLLTLHDPEASAEFYRAGHWRSDTFYSLLCRNARQTPERFALRDHERRLTWSEALAEVEAVAAALEKAGLRRGDRVAVWLPNRVEVPIVLLACSRNGYVHCASFHQNYAAPEVLQLMERVEARAFIGQPGHGADHDLAAIEQVASLPSMAFRAEVPARKSDAPLLAGWSPYPSLFEGGGMSQEAPVSTPDKIVNLSFTSGTSGEPKGVLHSDNTLLSNARHLVEDWRHPPTTVLLSLSPMTHAIGTIAVGQALVGSFELVLNDNRSGASTLEWIEASGATYVMGVPTHAIDVLAEMERRKLAAMGAVRVFYMGGAAIPPTVIDSLHACGVKPQSVYGMTENGAHQYTRPEDEQAAIATTSGQVSPAYEVRIWNAENCDVEAPPGVVGEIGGRGACLMLGYFSDQKATERAFNKFGWFMSGDLGRLDANGRLQVVGRKKDTIVRGGKNIYPLDIEAVAVRNPRVRSAAAFPVPDARLGERIGLAIVPRSAGAVSADELLAFMTAEGLAKYNRPEFLVCLEQLPLTPSGKPLKRELTRMAAAGELDLRPVEPAPRNSNVPNSRE